MPFAISAEDASTGPRLDRQKFAWRSATSLQKAIPVAVVLWNHPTFARRQFVRQRMYSLLNVSGLAVAFASALLIGMFVADEFGYDRFHESADRIHPVTNISTTQTDETMNAAVRFKVGEPP